MFTVIALERPPLSWLDLWSFGSFVRLFVRLFVRQLVRSPCGVPGFCAVPGGC